MSQFNGPGYKAQFPRPTVKNSRIIPNICKSWKNTIGQNNFFVDFIGSYETLLMSHDLQNLGMIREFFTVG